MVALLQAITISNFALIDELCLEFEPGLNILSGETGAGKSIIIDALGMALGERASTEFIRQGASSARVDALFTVTRGSPLSDYLAEAGITYDDHVVLTRELNASGRNFCRVNGSLVTTTQLKDIARYLVDIHGQHQHQSLLNPNTHLSFLDSFGGQQQLELAEAVYGLYLKYQRLLYDIKNQDQAERTRFQRMDMLKYQIEEIEAAHLVPGEKEELLQQKERLQQRESLLELVGNAYQLLYGSDRDKGVLDLLGQAEVFLEQAATIDNNLMPDFEDLASMLCQLEDLVPRLRTYQEDLPVDSTGLAELEERLELIRSLSRKYGADIEEILSYANEAEAELQQLQLEEQKQDKAREELGQVIQQLTKMASELSDRRQDIATRFEESLAIELANLAMEKAQVKVLLSTEKDDQGLNYQGDKLKIFSTGFDKAEFLLMANPGEMPKSLAKIGSGGEIARVMLAIKTVLAGADAVSTLIFDEIDAGIGGRAAQKVASKLAHVSKYHQIICITHLPQIAATGNCHFYIYKKAIDGKTYTKIRRLTKTERIQELARMLAGNNITPVVLQHAEQLLQQNL